MDSKSALLWIGMIALVVAPPQSARAGDDMPPVSAPGEYFEAKVRPILEARCVGCHGPEKQKAGLRLDSSSAMKAGGDGGPIVVPGEPEKSALITAIRHSGEIKMPPKGKLEDREIAILTDWVKNGAHWSIAPGDARRPTAKPETFSISEADRGFWAFQPIRATSPPSVHKDSWPAGAIDRYVLAQLEEHGLEPAPPAEKRVLIRRATFDLIGLPPTPQEVDAFLADDAPDAFAKVVDRLLASPHYGERWARHWLDVARYGEDQAHSFQPRLYPNGWRYRDWVASALNADLPYNTFLRDQIEGDLVDEPDRPARLPALGFFACGPVYYGDPKKFDQIDDRIDTLCRGVLGLTVACARCHDHKFDPISTRDYYALAGVFASTDYVEAPLTSQAEVAAYEAGRRAIDELDKSLNRFLDDRTAAITLDRALNVGDLLQGVWMLKALPPEEARAGRTALLDRLRLDEGSYQKFTSLLEKASQAPPPELKPWFDLMAIRPPIAESLASEERVLESRQVATTCGQNIAALVRRKPAERKPNASRDLAESLIGAKGVFAINRNSLERWLSRIDRDTVSQLKIDLDAAKQAAPAKYPFAHALKDAPSAKDLPILIRGNPQTPGPEAKRGFLTILGGAPFKAGSGRKELADAITSPENPLPARVFVNRVWQHHFGKGLTSTASNFGKLGDPPSHPELLDYLASKFIADGWSIKKLHRAIMLSSTYRQSSRFDERAAAIDPENRWLWRMSRRRLEVEAWRDAMLAVSGRLDPAIGGPPIPLDDKANRRRTLYASVSRHDLSPLLRLFDFPDPNITSAERTRTTVPLQQLLVLNGSLVIDSAAALKARLEADRSLDARQRIDLAYRLLFARPPGRAELEAGAAYLNASDPTDEPPAKLSRMDRYAQVLLATNEFLFVD